MSNGDPYVYPGTNVLKNLFNEQDKSKLDTREQIVTAIAVDDLRKNPVKGKFDGAHLKEIHKRIFEKIYPFAGQNRTINMTKPEPILGGQSVKYGKAELMDEMLGEFTKPLETFKWDDNNKATSAKVFGQIMAKVWQAHAFREGNTRTTSVFMHQYASERGFDLDRAVTARYPSETRDIFAKATVGDLTDLTKMLVDARETALERNHPTIGRLGEEAGQVLKLMGKPPIAIPAVGENVRGQVLTTSYSNVLVAQGRDVKAVALANFDKAPANNDRINIVVKELVKTIQQDNKPQEKSNETRTIKVAPPKSKDHDRGR